MNVRTIKKCGKSFYLFEYCDSYSHDMHKLPKNIPFTIVLKFNNDTYVKYRLVVDDSNNLHFKNGEKLTVNI